MSSAKLAAATGLAALALSACGTATPGHGKLDDPRSGTGNHLACLQQAHLPVQEVTLTEAGEPTSDPVLSHPGLQIGALPAGPTVVYDPTAGAAQASAIGGTGHYQGAEVIGSALLYVHGGSDSELKQIETCLAQGVSG
jgi:hypothetical protein